MTDLEKQSFEELEEILETTRTQIHDAQKIVEWLRLRFDTKKEER